MSNDPGNDHSHPHEHAPMSLDDVVLELQARFAESESLLAAARRRAVEDNKAWQRLIAERDQLVAQLAESQDAYEQLSILLEQQQSANSEQPTDDETTAAPEPSAETA